eukprot:9560459-Ditylum_brightwellii.AAC.1
MEVEDDWDDDIMWESKDTTESSTPNIITVKGPDISTLPLQSFTKVIAQHGPSDPEKAKLANLPNPMDSSIEWSRGELQTVMEPGSSPSSNHKSAPQQRSNTRGNCPGA